jgi:hypothetical protein
MKVIGAGFMRTGTMSMQAALHTLDWHTLFRRFEATVDMPACLYYEELLQAFPDAEVILTVRDPDRWYASS